MRRILYFLIPIVILGGVIAWRFSQNKSQEAAQTHAAAARKKAAPSVRVADAVIRDIVHVYEGVGNVESRSDVRIASKVTGRVDFLQVREGDPVHRGDVLVRLDPSEIQASINQQQANVTSAQATLNNAQIRYNRTYSLYKQAFTAAQDVDDARAQVAVSRSALNAGLAQLHNLQAQLADTILRAPMNGYVTARYLDPGSIVTAGQPIVTVQALRNVYVTTSVPEDIAPNIHTGIPASAVFDALPGRKFEGKVTQVDAAADPQSRQFLVRASFSNNAHLIKPGMFCRISIVTHVTHNAIVVPHEAVQKGPKGPAVTVVDNNLAAHIRPVQTGDQDAAGIAVTEGVTAGERVVTLASQPVRDGQTVKIDTAAAPAQSAGQPAIEGGGGGAPLGGATATGGGASAPNYNAASGGQASGAASGSNGSSNAAGAGTQGGVSGSSAPGASQAPAIPGAAGGTGTAGGSAISGAGSSGSVGTPAGGSGAIGGGAAGGSGTGGAAGGAGR